MLEFVFELLFEIFGEALLQVVGRRAEEIARRLRPARLGRAVGVGAEIQILGGEQGLVAEDEGLLDAILELPDVAGPRVVLEHLQCRRRGDRPWSPPERPA